MNKEYLHTKREKEKQFIAMTDEYYRQQRKGDRIIYKEPSFMDGWEERHKNYVLDTLGVD